MSKQYLEWKWSIRLPVKRRTDEVKAEPTRFCRERPSYAIPGLLRNHHGGAVLMLAGSFCFSAAAQTPSSPPIARARTQEVLLDLVVDDKKQRLVNNLRSTEVEVYEDGVRHDIKSFRFVSSPASDEGTSSTRTNTGHQLPDPNRQINLVSLVFDRLDGDARRMARQAIEGLLARPLPRNTWFAVIVLDHELGAIQEFTDDKDTIDRAVRHATDGGYAQYVNDSERTLAKLEQGALKESVMGNRASVSQAIMNRIITGMLTKDFSDLKIMEGRRQTFGLLRLAHALTGVEGRKTVIYFCEGLTRYEYPSIADIVSVANRNNVTFYPIDLRGLKTAPIVDPRGLASENTIHGNLIVTQMAMDELAKGTGGFAIANTNDVRMPLKRVMDQVASHYEISYIPESTNLDGHFRKIEVRLLRPGLKVQTRSGYFAVPIAPEK